MMGARKDELVVEMYCTVLYRRDLICAAVSQFGKPARTATAYLNSWEGNWNPNQLDPLI